MSFPLILHPDAQQEALDARAWYQEIAPGLASEFTRCLAAVLDTVARNPAIYAEVEGGFRKANLRRFPYQVFYGVGHQDVFILGIYHSHTDPQAKITRTASRQLQQ